MSELNKTIVVGIAGILFSLISMFISDYNRKKEVSVIEREKSVFQDMYRKVDSLYLLEVKHREEYKKRIAFVIDSVSHINSVNNSLTVRGLKEIDKEYLLTKTERDSIYNEMKGL